MMRALSHRGRIAALLAILAIPIPGVAASLLEFIGASTTPLDNPHDLRLSADGAHLYVSDVGNNRVAILDPSTLSLLGSFGADHQSGTHDVDLDAEGRLYVADTHNNRVLIYEMDGLDARRVGELGERVRGPEGVLVHPDGRVYVAGAWSGNVVAYRDGQVVGELTGLSSPHDLALSPEGNLWLADAGNDRMLLLSPELAILRELSGSPYDFDGVRYQDVLPDGSLIVADKNNHQVKIIGADGALLETLGSGRGGLGPGEFRTPEGVAIAGDVVWLSDSGNDRVVRYRLRWKAR